QLVALRVRRSGTRASALRAGSSDDAAAPQSAHAGGAPAASAAAAGSPVDGLTTDIPGVGEPAASSGAMRGISIVLLGIAAVAGVALAVLRTRGPRRACRDCGAAIGDSGDLCASCRHAAADALRRATAD